MQASSSLVHSAECLESGKGGDIVSFVYENLCNFRSSKMKQRRQRTEPDIATHRKRNRQNSSTTDTGQAHASNNFNPEHKLNPVSQETMGSEEPWKGISLGGSDVALQFAREVVLGLDAKELDSFICFLQEKDTDHNTTEVRQLLTHEIENFRTQEISLTQEDVNGIAQPAGDPDNDLGPILHCQSKEGGVSHFWDEGSPTIQLLSKKGLNQDVVFAYDWHWRGEGRARGRKSTCPASQWKKEKLWLHNQMSHRILEILPLPFLIIGGRCAREQYQKGRKHSAKDLNVKLGDGASITFEVLFEDQNVRRVTAFVDHPSVMMFNPNTAGQVSVRLDASLNFLMWLLAIPHDQMSFSETQAKFRKGIPGSAPLKEVHEYVKLEADLKRTLTVLEYDSAFLGWASTMLHEDVFKLLDSGQSVARALRTKIDDSISQSLRQSGKFASANRRRNAVRYGFEFKEFWDGEEVTLTARGYVSLHLSEERRALKFLVPWKVRKDCLSALGNNEKTVIFFTKAGVELKFGQDLIVSMSLDELGRQKGFGQEGIDQHHKELDRKGQVDGKENGESE